MGWDPHLVGWMWGVLAKEGSESTLWKHGV